jgi:hypothetical protein
MVNNGITLKAVWVSFASFRWSTSDTRRFVIDLLLAVFAFAIFRLWCWFASNGLIVNWSTRTRHDTVTPFFCSPSKTPSYLSTLAPRRSSTLIDAPQYIQYRISASYTVSQTHKHKRTQVVTMLAASSRTLSSSAAARIAGRTALKATVARSVRSCLTVPNAKKETTSRQSVRRYLLAYSKPDARHAIRTLFG